MTAGNEDVFWAVVRNCLRKFHKHGVISARRKTLKLRKAVEAKGSELFYHSEPFDVACDIAERQLDLKDHLDDYLHIRDIRHGL